MIEVRDLTKRYGTTVAVDGLSFTVRPGTVTGFLGPNGAGKSTTMRMILGLDRPSSGVALVNGRPFAEAPQPMREVGALLDAKAAHPGLTVRSHLTALAQSNGIARSRVGEVLELTGIGSVEGRRIKGLSLGMAQRLGLAAAMLGDPAVLLFDEPVNGLDPEGILWIRTFMKALAGQGRTVLVSSHLMSEMALTADQLVVIGRGRLIADQPTRDLVEASGGGRVRVTGPDLAGLRRALGDTEVTEVDGYLEVAGLSTAEVGDRAHAAGLAVHELFEERGSLEQAFMEMTRDSVEYAAAAPPGPVPSAAAGR